MTAFVSKHFCAAKYIVAIQFSFFFNVLFFFSDMLSTLLSLVTSLLFYSLLFLAGLWCWYRWTYRDLIRNAEKLPCIHPRWPLLGHLYYTLGALTSKSDYFYRIPTFYILMFPKAIS